MSRKASVEKKLPEVPRINRSFADLFGYDQLFSDWQKLRLDRRWPQVLVLEGRVGLGKRKLLAKMGSMLLCEQGNACGICQSCQSVILGYASDLLWLEREGPYKVSDADEIHEHLSLKASAIGRPPARVVVIPNLEKMTEQAANRLLKLLEEPPEDCYIIASTSFKQQLLPTIRSRLFFWRVPPPALELSQAWLSLAAKTKGLDASEQQLRDLLLVVNLSPGRALAALEGFISKDRVNQDRLAHLLIHLQDGQQLKDLGEVLKTLGWKAPALAQEAELILNRHLRKRLGIEAEAHSHAMAPQKGENSLKEYQRLRHWRKILHQVYKAGPANHNHLNPLFVAEALVSGTLSSPLKVASHEWN